ncbi:MAG: trigger factor [Planctomycetes bacterium]|nr:trigger factor [Planctomycetota bacterium]
MQVDIADSGSLGKRVSISWSSDEVRSRREQVLRKLGNQVKMPGFRPGKSTLGVVEKRFGAEATAKAEEELASEAFSQVVGEHKLKPIGPIANEGMARDAGLRLTFAFEVRPPIVLPDPTSLAITRDESKVDDAQIDEALNSLARRAGQLADLAAGETLQADDSITLTGKVSSDGQLARELHDFHHLLGAYPLLGKKPEEIIEMVKGKAVGAALAFDTTLPESFAPKEFAGKPARVEVTVQKAQRVAAAAIDDELAKKMGMGDLAALKEALRANLLRNRENELHQRQIDELVTDLVAKTDVTLPPKLLEQLTRARIDAAIQRAKDQSKSAAEIESAGKDAEADAAKQAGEQLKRHIVISAIVDQNQVTVTREDLDHQIRMAAQRSGQSPDAVAKRLSESGKINDVVAEIREAKALEVFLDLALGKTPAVSTGPDCTVEHVHGPDCNH